MPERTTTQPTGLFGRFRTVVRTERRTCDEDFLTEAVAACCVAVPELAPYLARELFHVDLADCHVETQCARDAGVRYDLVLGAGPHPGHAGGLVLEHKIESGFGARLLTLLEGDEAAGAIEVESQVETYLRMTAAWAHPPRVGAIVKYHDDKPQLPGHDRWVGCCTWTEFDRAVAALLETTTDSTARLLLPELRYLLRQLEAVMLPVPPRIHEPNDDRARLHQVLVAAVKSLSPPWSVGRLQGRASSFWFPITGPAEQGAYLAFRDEGAEVSFLVEGGQHLPTGQLEAEGFRPETGLGWPPQYRQYVLPLDFRTHTDWDAQRRHVAAALGEVIGRAERCRMRQPGPSSI